MSHCPIKPIIFQKKNIQSAGLDVNMHIIKSMYCKSSIGNHRLDIGFLDAGGNIAILGIDDDGIAGTRFFTQ